DKAPTHYWTRLWLAFCLQGSGDYRSAAEAYGACIALRPDVGISYGLRGQSLLLLLRDGVKDGADLLRERARRDLDRAVELDPLEPYVWGMRAIGLIAAGTLPEAMSSAGHCLDMQPPLSEWQHMT